MNQARQLAQWGSSISRALIAAANNSTPAAAWNRSLEQTLHRLGCRNYLTPSLVARVIDPHLLRYPSLSLGFFNWASHQPNFFHSSISYHSIFKSLCASRHFTLLEKLIQEAESRQLAVDPSVYRSMIAAYVKDRRTHDAFLILEKGGKPIEGVGPELCNLVLAGLVSDGFVDSARKLFDEMLVRRCSFSTLSLGLFIWKYCRSAELNESLGMLDEVRKGFSEVNGSIIAVLIIHGLCQAGRTSEAFLALEELRNRNFKPDFMAYRIVAEAFRSKGYIAEVHDVLKKKRKLGVAPRASDYREFILDLTSEGRIPEAIELGEVIVDGNFPIEDDVLGALIESASAINLSSAMIFFKHMIEKAKLPTLFTLSTLCENLCRQGKIDDLLEIFQILTKKEYFIDLVSYQFMIFHLSAASKVREAYDVLREMKKKGLNPDVLCYNILMEACCKEDLLRPAKRLWDEMFASGVDGNLKTYNILIKKFSETGQVEDARALLTHMLEKRVIPDENTFTPLLDGLCNDAKIDIAMQIFHKAANQDKVLAGMILTPFVLSLCKGGRFLSASKLLCGLLGVLSQSEPHVMLLKCMAEAREFQIAAAHMKNVMVISPLLLEGIHKELMALISFSSNPDLILQLLRQMPRNSSIDAARKDLARRFLMWDQHHLPVQ
ncbi:hypothetical protein Dimus_018630 [Dionaea muscipula]